ncbi:hypothetical protein SEEN199_12185 [Salmonella enterica subsp. enterica serovar Newport str. CVM 35199]|nr:hypothetical protein SEEN199_12185 [Salmonella enterica subsp. enterica serovar Newport str. CVM 35199]
MIDLKKINLGIIIEKIPIRYRTYIFNQQSLNDITNEWKNAPVVWSLINFSIKKLEK